MNEADLIKVKEQLRKPFSGSARTHPVYLGLGSNIDPERHLPAAVHRLEKAVYLIKASSVWETPAVGSDGPDFLNAALFIKTRLSPAELKHGLLRPLERSLGRVRTDDKNAARTIDIDILIYDGEVVDPKVWQEAFLAIPLSELKPAFQDPDHARRLSEAARQFLATLPITPRPDVRLWYGSPG